MCEFRGRCVYDGIINVEVRAAFKVFFDNWYHRWVLVFTQHGYSQVAARTAAGEFKECVFITGGVDVAIECNPHRIVPRPQVLFVCVADPVHEELCQVVAVWKINARFCEGVLDVGVECDQLQPRMMVS